MATRTGAKDEALPGSLLLVVHDFVARSTDELSLAKGDRIQLIERDDDFGDGWFLGRHMTNGNTGLFPEVYTTPAPKGTLNSANPPRRASEGPPKSSSASSAANTLTQQRHSATSAMSQRSISANTSPSISPAPTAQTTLRTSLPSSTSTHRSNTLSTDSPVMNETLSVIDEHMNDMNTPRSSYVHDRSRDTHVSSVGSTYSSLPLHRFSYITGQETDEEEQQLHTEAEVMSWSPERVAEYLEDHGVEKMHCDVFREQEITGEVLLAMDQSSIFIKEFDLGPVGRRLKTWHKIKALHDEVRRSSGHEVQKTPLEVSGAGEAGGEASRNRASTLDSTVPRALATSRAASESPGRSSMLLSLSSQASAGASAAARARGSSSLQGMTSISRTEKAFHLENTYRPSAQNVRTMQHWRRHSSLGSTTNSIEEVSRQIHRKQQSMDEAWEPGQPHTNGGSGGHARSQSSESLLKPESSKTVPSSPGDLDRGYSSSTELDSRTRTNRNILSQKGTSASPSPAASRRVSRQSTEPDVATTTLPGGVTNSEVRDRDANSPSTANRSIFGSRNVVNSRFGTARSTTSPQPRTKPTVTTQDTMSPVVTKLDYGSNMALNAISASPTDPNSDEKMPVNAGHSPTSRHLPFFPNKLKLTGNRATSDAVTKNEKQVFTGPSGTVDSPASTTPSTETKSIDLHKSEAQSRTSQGSGNNLLPPASSQRRARAKTKKLTSAYTRGLEKKAPKEQMAGCDYSGWMKKKSGSLMTTWKSRLFILRGRRLSYYYSDDDTEEKGLIDISFHRVLPATNETLTGLHASLTRAATSPTSPKDTTNETAAQVDLKQNPPKDGDAPGDGLFIFKLVPPKTGLSKGVNFTKPTVHYFAVNSRQEGRLWMAALMKATIDRDEDGVVTTTYNQKTISLAKARARRERPPALREDGTEGRAELGDDESVSTGTGLGIVADMNEKSSSTAVVTGAERELPDDSSLAPSTVATAPESVSTFNEKG